MLRKSQIIYNKLRLLYFEENKFGIDINFSWTDVIFWNVYSITKWANMRNI